MPCEYFLLIRRQRRPCLLAMASAWLASTRAVVNTTLYHARYRSIVDMGGTSATDGIMCVGRDEREWAGVGDGEVSSPGDPAQGRVPLSTRPSGSARRRLRVVEAAEPGTALPRPQGHDQGRLHGAPARVETALAYIVF